ncbi:MAG: nuclear transport factor 2 family protein [Pseudomonadota bacterium]
MSIEQSVRAYFQAFERKDRAAWVGLCAPDVVLGGPAHEPPVAGQAALSELFDRIAALFASIRFDLVSVNVAGAHAAAVFRLSVVGANGRAAQAEGIVAFAAGADGRFARISGFWNPAPVFAAAMA